MLGSRLAKYLALSLLVSNQHRRGLKNLRVRHDAKLENLLLQCYSEKEKYVVFFFVTSFYLVSLARYKQVACSEKLWL